jgi:hypothetical protein
MRDAVRRFRRWLCRRFGHRYLPSLEAPWWTFGRTVVALRCQMCGDVRPAP